MIASGGLWSFWGLWPVAVVAGACWSVVGMWIALGCYLVPGSTDRRRLRSAGVTAGMRRWRARAARVACAAGAWPHALDVLRRVDSYASPMSPSDVVAAHGPARLHRFAGDRRGPPVLIVHSIISSASVLDLSPHASLVRALLASGRDVWLLDWVFDRTPPEVSFDALAWEVARAADEVRAVSGAAQVPVVGYCLGGTLALLREATWPSGDPLALVAPVVDASTDGAAGMGGLLGHPRFHPTLALDERGFVPGPLIREAFHWLRPKALKTVRGWSGARRVDALAAGYAGMARWVWDHQALPGGLLFDAVDLFRRGGLQCSAVAEAAPAPSLARVRVPVLVVCATRDHIVPPASSKGLTNLVSGPVEVVEIDAGHVGMLVSLGSGDLLRPALLGWLDRYDGSSAGRVPSGRASSGAARDPRLGHRR